MGGSSPGSVRCEASNVTTPRLIVRGHALMQNLRRGHIELGVDRK